MIKRIVSFLLSIFKYIVAVFMMYAGVATAWMVTEHEHDPRLGFIYNHHWSLVLLGVIFFLAGAVLFWGKVRKKRRTIGHGLMATYLCFLFGAIIVWYADGVVAAVPNSIAALITAGLYLRWKYHIYYYEPSVDKVQDMMVEFYSEDAGHND